MVVRAWHRRGPARASRQGERVLCEGGSVKGLGGWRRLRGATRHSSDTSTVPGWGAQTVGAGIPGGGVAPAAEGAKRCCCCEADSADACAGGGEGRRRA
eukprot:scaffold11997_cov67-Isochrysis_galbana.AAC.1